MSRSVSSGIISLIVLSMTLQACATIMHGSRQDVHIRTMPEALTARIETQMCVTPCTLRVPRLAETLYLAGAGDIEKAYPLVKRVNTFEFYVGNMIFLFPGALIGIAIDYETGARYTIQPVNIVLPIDRAPIGGRSEN